MVVDLAKNFKFGDANLKVHNGVVDAGHPDFTGANNAEKVDAAIQFADGLTGEHMVLVPESLIPYDPTAMPNGHLDAVRMVREGQIREGHDVGAYGAAGDDPGDGTGTDDKDAIEAALSNAGDTEPVILTGAHTISGTLDLSVNNHVIDFRDGHLVPSGDFIVLRTPDSANRFMALCREESVDIDVPGGITHTSVGVVMRSRFFTEGGPFRVQGPGSHGLYVLQEGSSSPFPSHAVVQVENPGGDAVRFENTTGGVSNLNGLFYDIVEASNATDAGVRIIDGIGLQIRAVTEGCGTGFISDSPSSGSDNKGHHVELFEDSSNTNRAQFNGGSGFITGFFNAGRPRSGGSNWTVFDRQHNEMHGSQGANNFSRALALRNQSANDSGESVDLEFLGSTGLSNEELLKIRARGNSLVEFLSGLRYIFDDGVEIQDSNRETLSGDKSLTGNDPQFQNLDPGGAARNVDLSPEADGKHFWIACRGGASNDITVRDDAGSTLATVNPGDVAVCHSDGTGWMVNVSSGAVT